MNILVIVNDQPYGSERPGYLPPACWLGWRMVLPAPGSCARKGIDHPGADVLAATVLYGQRP